jgi:elongation factor G
MIRTVALVGHAQSGKTTLTEALLYKTGAKDRMGRVEDGTTTTDYTPEAKLHRTTVRTGVAPLRYKEHRIFLLDAPGYGDFVGEIRGALEAADAALVAVSAENGVQVGTERAWTVAERLGLPRMVVVTKLDKGGDYYALLSDLRSTLGHILPIDLPLYEGGRWVGLIDVFHGKAYRYGNGEEVEVPIPEEEKERATRFRQEVLEAIVETDESLLEKYLEGEEVTGEALEKAFHEAVRRGLLYPVALASGATGIGVLPLLDLILEAFPSPEERFGEGPALAKVFKVQVDPFMGQVAYVRLYRGRLKPGDTLMSEAGPVRLPHLYVPMGKDLLEVEEAEAGYILGLPKAENLHRGMVLWQGERPESEEIPFARLPEPNVPVAIHPKGRTDEAKLGEALRKLLEEDPSLKLERQEETGELLLWGHGELHLTTAKERLADYGVEVEFSVPKVPYRETIRRVAEGQGKYKKQTGGHGQYGDVWLRLEPAPEYSFEWRITGRGHPLQVPGGHREGDPGGGQEGGSGGLPRDGLQGHRLQRLLPRGGLLGPGLPDRRQHGLQEGDGRGEPHPFGAHLRDQGPGPPGAGGGHPLRPAGQAGPDPGHGAGGGPGGRAGRGAFSRGPGVLQGPPRPHGRRRGLHPGVQPLPGGAPAPGPEDHPEPGPGGLRWPWSA